jgi:hypothetical protein
MRGLSQAILSIFLLCLLLGAAPAHAVSITVILNSGSNIINAGNQSAVSIKGKITSFIAGQVIVVLTDSLNTAITGSRDLVGLDNGNYSLSLDASSLVDGPITVNVEALPTGGSAIDADPVAATKQTVTFVPDIVLYGLPTGALSGDCVDHPENLSPYNVNISTNKSVCAFVATTSSQTVTPLNASSHFFAKNDAFTFTYQDVVGNTGSVVATVANIDTDPPFITLGGSATVTLAFGAVYTEEGATAADVADTVTVGGDTVNTGVVGTYTVTYDATDAAGNHAVQVTRTVTVDPAPTPSGGGGGGGGGPIFQNTSNGSVALPTTPPRGQVLGAEVFRFTKNLKYGMTDSDVMELQKRLIAEKFLTLDAPTNYFGPLTFAAVKKYQTAHGIVPVLGFVGPLTRAELNK